MTTLLSTTIAAAASVLGAYFAIKKSNHERDIKDAQREQRQSDRLDHIEEKIGRLEHKVDTHNGYAEKFADSSKCLAVMSRDIEYLKQRV